MIKKELVSSNENSNVEITLDIIVYKHHNSEDLYKKIVEEYCLINGKPTELTMNLYYSKWQKKYGEPYRTEVFD